MEKYLKITDNKKVNYWLRNNLTYHLSKHEENQTEIEHIIDFLVANKIGRRQLKKMSYFEILEKTQLWNQKLINSANRIVETEEDTKTVIKFNNGFRLVKLLGQAAFSREGNLMRHCASSYFGKGCEVYSLRDTSNNPHCTIEVQKTNGIINQIKGKGNGSIHPKYIGGVLEILKYFKMNVRDSEMSNLGYDTLSDDLWSVIEKNFTGIKQATFNGKKYFFRYSNLKKAKGAKL